MDTSPRDDNSAATASLCERYHIDAREIARRREYLGLTAERADDLERIHAVVAENAPAIVDEFYQHILDFDEVGDFFADPKVLKRQRGAFRKYLDGFGKDVDQPGYFESRLRIGATHERVGLVPKWYLGAYATLFSSIAERLLSRYQADPALLSNLLVTLNRLITLDAVMLVETYYGSSVSRLETSIENLTVTQEKLERISRIDDLTQISNRRFILEWVQTEIYRSKRFDHPFSMLFVDIDHFKKINDRYGHGNGDFVLQRVARLIRNALRPADEIGRYGGEEFIVGLVEAGPEGAQRIAERVREKIANTPFEFSGVRATVTVSIGIATLSPKCNQPDALLREADKALYAAKHAGRNKVMLATT